MIEMIDYRPAWPQEFLQVGREIRAAVGERALRIDHIGSTSVPGLVAKDVIDVQMTVPRFDPEVRSLLEDCGYRQQPHMADHIPPGAPGTDGDWEKWVFTEPPGRRRVNLHVRREHRPNQRYALLFRDYLRTHSAATVAYARTKQALARLHPDDKDAYYEVKDPITDIIMEGAEAWAAVTGWKPGPSDC